MDPAKAGAYIASVAMREGHHHPLYAIRFDYKFFTFLAKVLPARFLKLAHLLSVRKIRTKALPGGEGLPLHDTPPPAQPGAAWFTSSAEGSFRRRR